MNNQTITIRGAALRVVKFAGRKQICWRGHQVSWADWSKPRAKQQRWRVAACSGTAGYCASEADAIALATRIMAGYMDCPRITRIGAARI